MEPAVRAGTTFCPDDSVLKSKVISHQIGSTVGSRINDKSSFDTSSMINSATLKELHAPAQKPKEKVELKMSAKTSADEDGLEVPIFEI